MRKTLFSKYFYICSSIILISTTFLGVVLLVFSVQYFKDDHATELCRQKSPTLVELLPGHLVACHHAAEINRSAG